MQMKFMKRAVWAGAGIAAVLLAGVAQADPVPGQGTWETTLKGRDIDGNPVNQLSKRAVFLYDKTLDITWLRDAANLRDWWAAKSWADTLTVGTFSNWRLPTLKPVNGIAFQDGFSNNGSTDNGYAKTDTGWGVASEMGHLFYVTLGNKGRCTPNDAFPTKCVRQPGWGLTNTGSFQNMQASAYWSGLEYAPFPDYVWFFDADEGLQSYVIDKAYGHYALAVRPGDVHAVPEPQTYAMLLLGLGAVMVAVRRRPR